MPLSINVETPVHYWAEPLKLPYARLKPVWCSWWGSLQSAIQVSLCFTLKTLWASNVWPDKHTHMPTSQTFTEGCGSGQNREKCCILGFGGSEALRHVCIKNLPLKVPLFCPVSKVASFMRLSTSIILPISSMPNIISQCLGNGILTVQ